MEAPERTAKHLELIQGVINRLGANSFLLKGWSMTVLVGGSLLMVRLRSDQPLLALTLLVPVLGFWLLDAYFLLQERLFRDEYDRVRQQSDTDYEINPEQHKGKTDRTWPETFRSVTLRTFYLIEIAFVAILSAALYLMGASAEQSCLF